MTPLKAIRRKCLKCMADSSYQVNLCGLKDCPFYYFRFGKKDVPGNKDALTPIKSVKAFCLECSNQRIYKVRNCQISDCPVFPFRLGKNPNRKGIGNQKPKQ